VAVFPFGFALANQKAGLPRRSSPHYGERRLEAAGIEPAEDPCNSKDLEQFIVSKAENQGENGEDSSFQKLRELARILTHLSTEDRTILSRLVSADERGKQP